MRCYESLKRGEERGLWMQASTSIIERYAASRPGISSIKHTQAERAIRILNLLRTLT